LPGKLRVPLGAVGVKGVPVKAAVIPLIDHPPTTCLLRSGLERPGEQEL
jgi:hypothetical protein